MTTKTWACLVAQKVKNLPVTQGTRVQSLGQEDPLDKEMVTHSSILAWRGFPDSWFGSGLGLWAMGFSGDSAGKESACNAKDLSSIPGLGRSPGEGKGYPLQYSGLENSMNCIVHGVAKDQTQLSDFHFTSLHSCLENSTDRGGWWATVHGVAKS